MYAGFVITEDQYVKSVRGNLEVKVAWVKSDLSKDRLGMEEMYFKLDFDGILFIVASNVEFVREMLSAGVVYDLTTTLCLNLVELATSLQYSRSEYIHACNELRDAVAEYLAPYRVCGPEFECLFNEKVVKGSNEMVGLMRQGTYIEFSGRCSFHGFYPRIDSVYEEFEFVERTYADPGQRKLYSMFAGFAQRRVILYVGSAPGQAWISYALKNSHRVVSVDPRDLYNHFGSSNNVKRLSDAGIVHFKAMFTGWDMPEIRYVVQSPFDLIWDVRGDYVDDTQYEAMVRQEITLLNTILSAIPATCVRAIIKVRSLSADLYRLPTGGRFHFLPWCLERDKFELRYVVRLTGNYTCQPLSPATLDAISAFRERRWGEMSMNEGSFSNMNLFYASKMLRYDYGDYTVLPTVSERDMNLFTLNCNVPSVIKDYLDTAHGVVTFFTGNQLNADEYKVPYDVNVLRFAVVDSRIFIGKLIPNLVVLFPMDLAIFRDELLTSTNYRLRKTGHSLHRRYGLQKYHDAKEGGAAAVGKVFSRFPRPFSFVDDIITPSGHAMRIMIDELERNDFSVFGFFQKTLFNFYNNVSGAGKKSTITRLSGRRAPHRLELIRTRQYERNCNKIWHSLDEWLSGFIAGEILLGAGHDLSGIYSQFVRKYKATLGSYEGTEIREFKREFSLPIREVSIPALSEYGYLPTSILETKASAMLRFIKEKLLDVHGKCNFDLGRDFLRKRSSIADFLIRELRADVTVRTLWYHRIMFSLISSKRFLSHGNCCFEYDELIFRSLSVQIGRDTDMGRSMAVKYDDLHRSRCGGVLPLVESSRIPDGMIDEFIFDALAWEWLDAPTEEIFRPRRNTRWVVKIPSPHIRRVMIRFESLFELDDFFVLEEVRNHLRSNESLRGLESP